MGSATILFAPEGPSLASGPLALAAVARAVGAATTDTPAVLAALAGRSGAAAQALRALEASGRACELEVEGLDGERIRLVGRSAGALACLRLERGPPRLDEGLEAAFDAYPHPAWIAGSDGRVVRANRAWAQAVGAVDASSGVSAGLSLQIGGEDLVRQCLARGAPCEAVRSLALHGTSRKMLVRAQPVGAGGAVVWTLDVTSAQEAARVRERLDRAFDLTLSHLSDAVAVFDADQRLVRFNAAFARLWDLTPAWLGEQPRHGEWLDRLRQLGRLPQTDDYAAFKAKELARHGAPDPAEALWRLPQGETLRVVAQPHPDGGLVLVFSDVTDELRRTSRFNQLVQVQQASLDKLTDAVAVFGSDARLRLHNEAFQALWSLPPAVLTPGAAYEDLAERCVARLPDLQFWRALKTRITDPDPALRAADAGEAQTWDGRWLAWQSRPLPDGATLVSFADVTGARGLQSALADREAALETAERLKRDFVAAVSRELRVPLTTVLGYAELLDAAPTPLAEPMRGWIGAVRAAAGVLARSVDDILVLAELDAGERRLSGERLDLVALVDAAVAGRRDTCEAAGVSLLAERAGDIGTIEADRAALARVLEKLIDNALIQTPRGGRITVGAARAHGEVSLRVADTGRGIPFDVQARLFEREVGLEGGGAGLGLALVKALVELHGGWVSVESEPGRGARFTCHLPEARTAED